MVQDLALCKDVFASATPDKSPTTSTLVPGSMVRRFGLGCPLPIARHAVPTEGVPPLAVQRQWQGTAMTLARCTPLPPAHESFAQPPFFASYDANGRTANQAYAHRLRAAVLEKS